jgi:predicted RNA-binding Zn-ribbon protein involved in translation (DUF1610 family)
MTADTWRRSEAEVRQEMDKHECVNCGVMMDDCDAWECPECGDHYCHKCRPELIKICFPCFERDDCFEEVDQIGKDDIAGFKAEQLKDDKLTGEEWTK